MTSRNRKFHQLRGVSGNGYRFHCQHCDKYFTREPNAATCRIPKNYEVIGAKPWAVAEKRGGIVYDLLETKGEAKRICDVLNMGIGPEWESVEKALKRLDGGAA